MITQVEKEVELLERHLHILERVIEAEPIGIVKLSNQSGYERHEVRYSLRMLEEEGLIEPSQQGAITTDTTEAFVSSLDDRFTSLIERLDEIWIEITQEGDQRIG